MEPISTKKENSNSEPRVLSASNQGNQETKANQTPLLFVNETKNKIASQEEEEEEQKKTKKTVERKYVILIQVSREYTCIN